jgi:hypothetical protein
MMKILITVWLVAGLTLLSATQPSLPNITVCDEALFKKLNSGLNPKALLALYRPQLKLERTAQTLLTPGAYDSLFTVRTADDRLKIFTNTYRSVLLSADIHSDNIDFGQGIRIGCSRMQFCKVLQQQSKYEVYHFIPTQKRDRVLSFWFRNDKLYTITYVNSQYISAVEVLKFSR